LTLFFVNCYLTLIIKTFRGKALKLFAAKGDASKLPVQNKGKVRRQLAALNAATKPEDLNLPGYRFHGLEGDPKRYAVGVTGNYRLTWGWEDPDAVDVDLEDYH
jgi:proteic killer suppression protein